MQVRVSHDRISLRFFNRVHDQGVPRVQGSVDDPEDHSDLATMRSAYNILKLTLSPDANDYRISVLIRITR